MNENFEITVNGNNVALDCESQGLGVNSKRAKTNLFNKVVSTELVGDNIESGSITKIPKVEPMQIGEYSISPGRIFYRIEDAVVADDTEKVNTEEVSDSMKKFKSLYGDDLGKYLKNYTKALVSDIPIMDYKTYLNEIQKLLSKRSKSINYFKLKRFRVNLTGGYRTDSVIVLGKPGTNIILNVTLYRNGEFVRSVDYDLEELYAHVESLEV